MATYGPHHHLIGPAAPPQVAHQVTYHASDDGNFYIPGWINGVPIRFRIDTGADDISLSETDARAANLLNHGVRPGSARLVTMMSADGAQTATAAFLLQSVRVGRIVVNDVPASLNTGNVSLLGVSFINRLGAFRIENGRVFMRD